MPTLTTPRLALLPLSRAMLQARVERDDFDLVCDLPEGRRSVHFPPAWPGDPLPAYPGMLAALDGDEVFGSFAAIDPGTGVAVGALGTVGPPDETGAQEIGYGFNPDVWGRGFATEAVAALVPYLLAAVGITAIVADTAVANRASERVLEKNGFVRVGTGHSDEDGDLIKWQFEPPPGEVVAHTVTESPAEVAEYWRREQPRLDALAAEAQRVAPTLVGMAPAEAEAIAAGTGLTLRFSEGMVTADYRFGRITCIVRDGVIVTATVG